MEQLHVGSLLWVRLVIDCKTFSLPALLQNMFTELSVVFNLSEVPKTDKSFEERLIFKTFVLKFANAFTPIVYLAFFRGR